MSVKNENYRNRNHMLLLYPEDKTHMKALEVIEKSYDYALILHDKDKWTSEDEAKNPDNKADTLKKAHYHVFLRFPQAKWRSALAKELEIAENYIEEVKKVDNALLYLIHYNDTDKEQYEIDEVKGPLKKRLVELINKNEKSEGEKVSELLEYIENCEGYIPVSAFAKFCAMNGYWSEFRRSGSIFIKILEEHNQKYYKSLEKGN